MKAMKLNVKNDEDNLLETIANSLVIAFLIAALFKGIVFIIGIYSYKVINENTV